MKLKIISHAFITIIMILWCLSSKAAADTNWKSIGPFSGDVCALVIDPTNSQTVYAGTWGGGVFKTTNGGASWSAANNGLTSTSIDSLAIDPSDSNIIYAGTYIDGIFKTTNGGTSWTRIGVNFGTDVRSIAINPSNNQIIYAGIDSDGHSDGIYKSTDGGVSWTTVNSGITSTQIYSLAIDSSDSQTVYVGTATGGVFKTNNGGASWTAVNTGLTDLFISSIAIDPNNAQVIYAGTGKGVYVTTNDGALWTSISSGMPTNTVVYSLVIDSTNSQIIYAGSFSNGLFKSINSGTSWVAINSGNMGIYVRTIAIDPTDRQTIFAGTRYADGIFKSINGGALWKEISIGLTNTDVRSIVIDPINNQTVYVGTYSNGLYKTIDGGGSWTAINNGLAATTIGSLAIDPSDSQTIYALAGGVFKSTDGGGSWTAINKGLSSTTLGSLVIDLSDTQTVYVGTYYGVYKTNNGGILWTSTSSGLPYSPDIRSLAIDPSNNQIIYLGTNGYGLFKTTNGGMSWTSANNGLTQVNVYSIAIDSNNSNIIYAGTYGGGIFKTNNGGSSWVVANSNLIGAMVYSLAIDPNNSQTIYAGTRSGGVYKTSDCWASWAIAVKGSRNLLVASLAIDPINSKTVYAGTSVGIFKTLLSNDIPTITGATSASFSEGSLGIFRVTTSGWPPPQFSISGTLPSGILFNASTGVLSGSPDIGTVGTYPLIINATNGIPPDAVRGITLTILPESNLTASITLPTKGAVLSSLTSILGSASGDELNRVELQITDGIYYLLANGTFSTTPTWISALGSTSWFLDTSGVSWRESIAYTIQARASDGSATSVPVSSIFTIVVPTNKTATILSVTLSPGALRAGDSTTISGLLVKPDSSAVSGQIVKLIITPPSTASTPNPEPIITTLTTDSNGAFASGPLSLFAAPGVYIVQVRFDGTSALAVSFNSQVLGVTTQSGYAIIVSGKAADNTLLSLHKATTDSIYGTLTNKRGFLPANINYLQSTEGTPVTKQQIQDAITVWAKNKLVSTPAPLYLIMIDHGTTDGFVLGTDTLTPDELSSWMNALETDPAVISSGSLDIYNRFLIIGACNSGVFINKLSKHGRVIITSAGADERSIAGFSIYNSANNITYYGGEYFIDTLVTFLGRGDSFKDAFEESKLMVALRDPRKTDLGPHSGVFDTLAQHPLMDDNGDKIASYILSSTTDGGKVANLSLGVGIKTIGNPADITKVTPTAIIPADANTTYPLWLEVGDNSRVAKAWIEIRTPDTTIETGTSSGQVIPRLVTLPLYYDGILWQQNYNFPTSSVAGTYDILYYTQDIQTGDISPAAHSVVYKNKSGNAVPSAFNLIAPDDGISLIPLFPLFWQEVISLNNLTYTLLVSTHTDFSNIVYQAERIPQAATYIADAKLKDPKTGVYYCQSGQGYCYWKVKAIDSFGAETESNIRSFTITPTSGELNSIVMGTILNNATGAALPAATVSLQSVTTPIQPTLSTGYFIVGTPSAGTSSPSITVQATGYKTRTIPITLTSGSVVSASIYLERDTKALNVTVTGTGIGTVNSVPTGIACAGTGVGCSAPYNTGTSVTLTAFPSSISFLSAWGGACRGNNLSCVITLNGDANVTANFMAMPPVKRTGASAAYFDTLTAAFDACPTVGGVTFQAMAREFSGNVTYACAIDSTLNGGFDGAFTNDGAGTTVIHGALTVKQGRLAVRNIAVR